MIITVLNFCVFVPIIALPQAYYITSSKHLKELRTLIQIRIL